MNRTTRFAIVASTCLIGLSAPCDHLDAQGSPTPRAAHSQTQDGITVQLEKVTVERIVNTSAWLKATENESKSGKLTTELLKKHLPGRLVTLSVSVMGPVKQWKISKIDFVDGKRTVTAAYNYFSPAKWQRHLANLAVAPTAYGVESQHLLNGKTQLADVFPAKMEVKVTTVQGKELTFVIRDIEF